MAVPGVNVERSIIGIPDLVQDISRPPKLRRGKQVDLPVRFLKRCVHCLSRFQAPEPERNCCPACFGLKHNHEAKTFDQCPRCRLETSDSITNHILRTPEKPRRYHITESGRVLFKDDDYGIALRVAKFIATKGQKDVAVEDVIDGGIPLMVVAEKAS